MSPQNHKKSDGIPFRQPSTTTSGVYRRFPRQARVGPSEDDTNRQLGSLPSTVNNAAPSLHDGKLEFLLLTTPEGSDIESCQANSHLLDMIAWKVTDTASEIELGSDLPAQSALALPRIEAVRSALVRRGVPVDRIAASNEPPSPPHDIFAPRVPDGVRLVLLPAASD